MHMGSFKALTSIMTFHLSQRRPVLAALLVFLWCSTTLRTADAQEEHPRLARSSSQNHHRRTFADDDSTGKDKTYGEDDESIRRTVEASGDFTKNTLMDENEGARFATEQEERDLLISDNYCNLCGCELNECAIGTPSAFIPRVEAVFPRRYKCGSLQRFVNGPQGRRPSQKQNVCRNPSVVDLVLEHCDCYNVATGDPVTERPSPVDGSWTQTTQTTSPRAGNTRFGTSLTMAGGILVAGEPSRFLVGNVGPGQVQPFQRNRFGRRFLPALVFSDETESGTEQFGSSVDMILDTNGIPSLVVGAPRTKGIFNARFGVGFYFEYDANGETWNPVGGTMKSDETLQEAGGVLGTAVSIAQTINGVKRVALGAPSSSVAGDALDTGRFYTYELLANTWTKMTAQSTTGPPGSFLGAALDFSRDGESLAVGLPGSIPSENDPSQDGRVWVYDWDAQTSTWERVEVLDDAGPDLASFGRTVEFIDEDMIAVGGPTFNVDHGMVRVYQRSVNSTSFTPIGDDLFGGQNNSRVGATLCGNSGRFATAISSTSFAVYSFSEQTQTWEVFGSPLSQTETIVECALSENGNTLALTSSTYQIAVYDLFAGESS